MKKVMKMLVALATISPMAMAYNVPHVDDAGTIALWHNDSIVSNKYIYNDGSVTGIDQRLQLSPNGADPTYLGPVLSDPATIIGLDYPAGNADFGSSLHFDGATQGALSANLNGTTLIDPSDFRVEGWFNPDNATDGQKVVDIWGTVGVFTNSDKLTVQVFTDNGVPIYGDNYAPLGINPSGEWIHFAVDIFGTDMNVYLNGDLVRTQALPGNMTGGNKHFYLAQRYQGDNKFTGYIDEIRIAESSVPEPATMALLAAGGLMMRRKKRA